MDNSQLTFAQQCYALLHKIPKGKVTTYREIAHALNTKAYQAVGNAMGSNPHPITTPCHRVVKSNGEIGGFALGIDKKIELLSAEGVSVSQGRIDNLSKSLFLFPK